MRQSNNITTPEAQPTPQEVSQPAAQTLEAPKQKPWIIIGMLLLVLLLLVAAGFFAYQNYRLEKEAHQVQPTPTLQTSITSPIPTIDPTANWKTHKNGKYGFSIKYPKSWKITEVFEEVIIHEGENPSIPAPYQFGRITFSDQGDIQGDNLEHWFDLKYYPEKLGIDLPSTSRPDKEQIFENENGVELLKTSFFSNIGYYFVSQGKVVMITFNLTYDEEKNNELTSLYDEIIQSLQLTQKNQ